MQNSKYSKALTIGLIVIVIIIIGLLIFWGVSALSKNKLENDAEEVISHFDEKAKSNNNKNNTNTSIDNIEMTNPYENMVFDEGDISTGEDSENKTLYKGFTMIGYIEIPKTKVKYPILEETSAKALEASVCKLYGAGLNKEGNTVLVAHNYRNGTFFSDNAKLAINDKIYITDETGQKLTYTIYHKYQTTPEDADYATREIKPGDKEITLSTCTDDSQGRVILLARAD